MKSKNQGGVAAYLEYLLVAGIAKGLFHLPSSLAYSIGEGLGAALYRVDHKHRLIAQDNLRQAFSGEHSSLEIAELARSTFINLGRTVVETCRILKIDRENFRQYIRVEGYEHFQEAKRRGKGIIYITAHLGSWELLPLASALMGEPLAIVTRPLDNPYLDKVINRLRTAWGTRVLPKKLVMPALVQALFRGESVGILMDQNITWKEGVFVDFFGRPACTALAPALLALRTDASVLPAAIVRRGRDRHTILVEKEIPLVRTGHLRADVVANTASFTRAIEALVRKAPAQWLWVHRRWKTQPRAESQAPGVSPGILNPKPETMRFPTLHVRKTFEPDRLRSILVASPNWLGDAVLALPALANLRRSFPSARISLLVRPWLSPLFRSLPSIDELVELPGRGELKWAATALRQRDFELALLLPNSFRIALISRLAGIPHRVGYATDWRDFLLTVGVRPSSGTPLHQADSYLGLLRALKWDAWLRPTGFLRPPGSDAEVEKLLAQSDLPPYAPVVGITPGATYGTAKRWPVERFAEVADRLADRFGTVALLFGSSSEASLTRAIRSRMRGAAIDFGGRTTLAELAGLLSRCALLLTNDTGPMHLASALGIPCVALFGSTDPHRTGPLGSGHQVLHDPPTCSPCRYRDCPIDHRCMQGLDVERVVAAAESLLIRSPSPADASIRLVPAVFLDRDGTINEEVGPIQRPDMMRPIPKAAEALKRLGEAGYRRIVVSNQARVARGDATEELVEASHRRLLELLQADGGGTDAFYYCPHHPEEGRFPYRRDCLCRKPAPGLIQRAAYEQQVDLERSYVVGDKVSDMLLADGLGLPSVLVLTGYGRESLERLQSTGGPMPAYTARDLLDATEWIVQRRRPA